MGRLVPISTAAGGDLSHALPVPASRRPLFDAAPQVCALGSVVPQRVPIGCHWANENLWSWDRAALGQFSAAQFRVPVHGICERRQLFSCAIRPIPGREPPFRQPTDPKIPVLERITGRPPSVPASSCSSTWCSELQADQSPRLSYCRSNHWLSFDVATQPSSYAPLCWSIENQKSVSSTPAQQKSCFFVSIEVLSIST